MPMLLCPCAMQSYSEDNVPTGHRLSKQQVPTGASPYGATLLLSGSNNTYFRASIFCNFAQEAATKYPSRSETDLPPYESTFRIAGSQPLRGFILVHNKIPSIQLTKTKFPSVLSFSHPWASSNRYDHVASVGDRGNMEAIEDPHTFICSRGC